MKSYSEILSSLFFIQFMLVPACLGFVSERCKCDNVCPENHYCHNGTCHSCSTGYCTYFCDRHGPENCRMCTETKAECVLQQTAIEVKVILKQAYDY